MSERAIERTKAEVLSRVHRRFELRMSVGGDDIGALRRLTMRFCDEVERRDPGNVDITSGGSDSGGWVFVVEDPEMTHEQWEADLEKHLAQIRGLQPKEAAQ